MKMPSDKFYEQSYEEPQIGDVVAFIHGRTHIGIVKEVGKRKCLVAGEWGEKWVKKEWVRPVRDKRKKAKFLRSVKEG